MVLLTKGDNVWVDSEIGVPIGARVRKVEGDKCIVVDDAGKERVLSHQNGSTVSLMHPTSVEGVADMIRLGDLNEAGLLRNLQLRHKQGFIYTYIGSVLVAVNPYELLPIYTAEQVHRYHGRQLGELPPHVFAIADSCYFHLRRNHLNQCCIISGESGAGKTESTKLMLQYLAAVSGQHSWIEQQILEANPILEAFGNARTIRNDNSSRFGKYVEIFFNKKGVIQGAHMEQYLLEKSRVCHQAPKERNYHIFYCLLLGLPEDQKKILSLGKAEDYSYLRASGCISCESRDDASDYSRIRTALKILTFRDKDCWDIFKLLAAILHMGNIDFRGSILNNMDSSDISASTHFTMSANLLEVEPASLDTSLTTRTFLTNREQVSKPLGPEQARDTRDAFAKAIYSKMFLWLFEKINVAIHKIPAEGTTQDYQSIGLLDIFGFENFTSNSFEQLCINFANEQLQQFFVRHVFKLEQEEYTRESISWERMVFSDNQPTLDLLAGKPLNILALIDEESLFPKGTDATMLTKMNQVHRRCNIYVASKSDHDIHFGIKHFAGEVYYNSTGFLEKNRDALSSNLIGLVQKSGSKILKQIFEKELNTNTMKQNNSKVIITPKSSLRQLNESRRGTTTLSSQYRQSLDSLMKALAICQPHFIRCFKPNHSKSAKVFDRELCMGQLRDSGMLETIRIRKSGYPIRHTFREFLGRYRVLLNTTKCDPNTEPDADCCNAICKAVIKQEGDWRIGKTKIFLKDNHDALLECVREKELHRKAIIITRVMLGHKDRQSYLKKKKAVLVMQKVWRGHRERKLYRKLFLGLTRLQACIRSRRARLQYECRRRAAKTLQTQTRGFLCRRRYGRQRDAAILLQTNIRGMLARKTANRLRTDKFLSAQERLAQEQNALELQRRLEILKQSQAASSKADPISDQDMVDTIFEFLPARVAEERKHEAEAEHEEEKPLSQEEQKKERKEEEDREEKDEEHDSEEKEKSKESKEKEKSLKKKEREPEEPVILTHTALKLIEPGEEEDGDEEFSFSRFCALHFQGSASESHIHLRLRQPLLPHEDEGDALACLSVWWIILRFMGDLPEPKAIAHPTASPTDSIQRNLGKRQNRRLSNLVGLDQKMLRKNKKISKLTGNRRASTIPEEPETPSTSEGNVDVVDNDIMIGEGPTFHRPMSSLEKLHIIVGYALSRPNIRDEIFCQICKQLTSNSNETNRKRGWVLMAICLGIFPPTDLFIRYLRNFIRRGPADYASYCMDRLRRTLTNGARLEPACWVELEACRNRKPVQVKVSLADGRSLSLQVDSASTSAEICSAITKAIGLRDDYGFSLYIALHDKMWSLGSKGEHVMDSIFQCEQEVCRQGGTEQSAPWKLSYRKELFSPWPSTPDPISTSLTYSQIISGLKSAEYQSDKEDDSVQLAAMHYFVKFGSASSSENARQVVKECINTSLIESKSEQKWIQMVTSAHTQGSYIKSQKSPEAVKQEVVNYARQTWPMFFSRFFEVSYRSGPPLPQDKLIMSVNWNGVSFFETKDNIFLELPYAEMIDVVVSDSGPCPVVSLSTLRGEITMEAQRGIELVEMVGWFLDGLRERSACALALHDAYKQDDPTFLVYRRGDILLLLRDEEFSQESGWLSATNERTGQTGAVSADAVMVLPTISRPTDDTLNLLNLNPAQRKSQMRDEPVADRVALINLKEFAFEYFREPMKGVKSAGREKLWATSREPLRHPLLKSLAGNTQLCQLALHAFTAIMKYMGDYPVKQARSPLELTNQIFGPPTQHPALRDEIYCQIMKQLTNNNNGVSVERGWQLLWLCSGLFPTSEALLKHTIRFMESRPREPLSATCLQRLRAMLGLMPRLLPPHQVEVDAIQQNSTQIFHKVHFPNDSTEIFEVTTTTKICDLCRLIASSLELNSADGYNLFVKTTSKMASLEDQQYFFDNLWKMTEASKKKEKKPKEGVQLNTPYLVIFMRKLWFNVIPGKDITADLIFHYPQEVPKYLRAYHRCSREDMISLAGLLFRVKVDSDRSQFVMIPRMLKDLVPADQMKMMTPEDWKKHIISSYNKQAGISVEEAKVSFLRHISDWPTFGCAFFEVKQTSDRSLPSVIRIAISKQGVSIINPKTKEQLTMHPFNQITNWSSGSTYFHMTLGNLVKGNTLLCETSLGYKMDDLLTSYINMYKTERQWMRPRNSLFPV
ncbi:unconventional myosin-VIIb isoform X2 [Clupea harengus]|uniref:Unconventional myosin-VIIb isoform X2 n=1 Tax=Clupea harengus TaxID=7950 RepID=A0A6P8GCT5_CLUHA|nr:unconventional myosin-VIIb isoform X2 [Clupea harengus]